MLSKDNSRAAPGKTTDPAIGLIGRPRCYNLCRRRDRRHGAATELRLSPLYFATKMSVPLVPVFGTVNPSNVAVPE
jgi:hypothetical protein